ncbi:NADH-quinone oxidoreductase subunit N [Burkholderiales bacterium]|jgi:NADH-quinone oxidoreductase subunit N|nr:NADH-quinone oxidoreductase subunit N [Burkholderiales bacterium]
MEQFNFPAILPEAILLGCACFILVADLFLADRQRHGTYVLSLLSLAAVAAAACVPLSAGSVQYAFGGMYLTDPMTAVLKLTAILATALTLLYAQAYARTRAMWRGEFFSLSMFALLGIMTMISANNLLVIYLGLELQSLSLYGLVALRRDDRGATEAAMKYFVLGALASGFLLYGMSILYGAVGTLDINELARRIASGQVVNVALILGTIFVVAGVAFKLGAAPFHMWVPDVYQGAPTPVTLLLASAPKLAAFAIAFRLLVEGLPQLAVDWQRMLALIAVASIAIGNVTAVAQTNLKRMLGYSTIGQMGFLLLALLAGVVGGNTTITAGAYGAAMFYVITYALATAGCFGCILLLAREGFEAEEIADFRGLAKRSPWYAFVMTVMMFSLAGVPPTMGFYAKLVVLQALISDGASVAMNTLAVVAVLFSLVGAYYYIRVVKTMWFDEGTDVSPFEVGHDTRIALTANGVLVLVLGILPQGLLALCYGAMLRALGG